MHAAVSNDQLRISFASGQNREWQLPSRRETSAIREVRDAAVQFAREQGATTGQQNAVKKALTNAGYFVSGYSTGSSV